MDVYTQPIIILPTGFQTSGPKTAAILIMHTTETDTREFRQHKSFLLNSNPFPAARISVGDGTTQVVCQLIATDVFSTTEFVLVVVTADGTSLKMYKNGVLLGSASCLLTPVVNSEPFGISRVEGKPFGGTIKSFALWDRALSDAEVAELDSTKLAC